MKTKLILSICAFFFTLNIIAQAPQSFNYQAVVRNNAGNILPNQNVSFQISIIQGSIAGNTIYTETHSAVTDAMGIVSLQIGNGTPSLGNFPSINWANNLYFLKIELDPLGGVNYQLSGTTQLLSVPYALFAENVANTDWLKNGNNINNSNSGNVGIGTSTPNSKLEVKGNGDTLFQVKDANGNPVFIVFPEGVRVIVKEGATKGNIGGFAVSGRSASKSTYEEVLVVTPDSTRVYVNQNAKGNIGGFAVSGRSASKGLSAFTYLVPDNYFIGHQAGKSVTSGKFNSFIGFESGYNNQVGSKNYFIGYRAGYNNVNGASNIFIGDSTGYNNSSGYKNIFIGNNSGNKNSNSSFNIFIGDSAGYSVNYNTGNNLFLGTNAGTNQTSGSSNIFIGNYVGYKSINSQQNVLIGFGSGYKNVSGSQNVFMGYQAGINNYKGSSNVFVGFEAGKNNSGDGVNYNGKFNVFIGSDAGSNNVKGAGNTYIGYKAGYNSNANNNIAIGSNAAWADTSGIGNVYIGNNAAVNKKNGKLNIIIGFNAAPNFNIGEKNIYIGAEAEYAGSIKNDTGSVFIGYRSGSYLSSNQKHKLYISTEQGHLIYGEFDTKKVGINITAPTQTLDVGGGGRFRAIATGTTGLTAIYITANGTLSTSASDIRLKENVTPLTNSILNKVLKVQGVNFSWKSDSTHKKCIGFIAQDMEEIFPEIVFTNPTDGFKGINYSEYTAVLNEAIKEQQKTIENQKQEIEQLKLKIKEIDELKIKNKQLEELILKEINSLKSQINK